MITNSHGTGTVTMSKMSAVAWSI